MKQQGKRLLSLLLVLVLTLGLVPAGALAAPVEPVQTIHVTVENTTCPVASGTWEGEPWFGVYAEGDIDYEEGMSALDCINIMLEQAEADENYWWPDSDEAFGLPTLPEGCYVELNDTDPGWLVMQNGWFLNTYSEEAMVAPGDDIRLVYSTCGGEDLGGSLFNDMTFLTGLTPSAGTLVPAFDPEGSGEYTLLVEQEETVLTLNPVPANRNYQVMIGSEKVPPMDLGYVLDYYRPQDPLLAVVGDTLYVTVGGETKNNAGSDSTYSIYVTDNPDEVDPLDLAMGRLVSGIRDAATGQPVNLRTDVLTRDVSLPVLEDLGLSDGDYELNYYLDSCECTDMGGDYGERLKIYCPPYGGRDKLTVVLTDKGTEEYREMRFSLKIGTLDQDDLYAAYDTLKNVADYAEKALLGENETADAVTTDLTPFVEGWMDEATGDVAYAYDEAQKTGRGIVPYKGFWTDNPDVIADETLAVTRPEQDTKVTVSFSLQSPTYGSYVDRLGDLYADLDAEMLEALADTYIEIPVLVKGSALSPVENAMAKIDAIGTVTFTPACLAKIKEADAALGALSKEEIAKVTNLEKFEQACKRYDELEAAAGQAEQDKTAAAAVDRLIGAIGQPVTDKSEPAIDAARAAFDKLSPAQVKLVQKQQTLLDAEKALSQVQRERPDYEKALNGALDYIQKKVTNPGVGSTCGEWSVLALARGGRDLPDWNLKYLTNLSAALAKGDAVRSFTDYERVALAVGALGLDASKLTLSGRTYDLVDHFTTEAAANAGNNSAAFALIALDSRAYDEPQARQLMIDTLVRTQKPGGAWAISEAFPGDNLDTTSMVVQALAPYYEAQPAVKTAVDKALTWIGTKQDPANGGFGSAEADAQVLTALAALGRDAQTAMRSPKNGRTPLEHLLTMAQLDGGFRHDAWSTGSNPMATDQAAYGLAAYDRFVKHQNRLYDMSDAKPVSFPKAAEVTAKIEALQVTDCKRATLTRLDAAQDAYGRLSPLEQEQVTNYGALAEQRTAFDGLLAAARTAYAAQLKTHYDEQIARGFSQEVRALLKTVYEDGVKKIQAAVCDEAAAGALATAQKAMENVSPIEVSFRLIGATLSDEPVDVAEGKGSSEYQTWIPTTNYFVDRDATAGDVFRMALEEYGLEEIGSDRNYVSMITAPEILGSYALEAFTNGPRSGWMFTMNGRHGSLGLNQQHLQDGDVMVWHYVNDYGAEVGDWAGGDPADKPHAVDWDAIPDTLDRVNDTAAAQAVDEQIAAIGTVTLNSQTAVKEARAAYEALTDGQKLLVEQLEVLEEAEARLHALMHPGTHGGDVPAVPQKPAEIPAQETFRDVPADAWYADSVRRAVEANLINGVGDGLFQPKGRLTVAEAIKLAAALHQMDKTGAVTLKNGTEQWYDTYVDYAIANQIVGKAYADCTKAQMDRPVTRAEFVKIFFGALPETEYAQRNRIADGAIPDVKADREHAEEIYAFYRAGILIGSDEKGTFYPDTAIERAEVATILIRMFDKSVRQTITLS